MAQFDVHRNPASKQDNVPYVVVVQSSVFDDYRRRVVVPLALKSNYGPICNARFQPGFTVKGKPVVLLPLDIGSVPSDKLGEPVASLAAHGERIIAALDELITRAFD
ncbi:MAG: plasmid maintenance protein CcdB [Dokdonella sp.]|nr:MAG: plasmid maintenance protein CcdB [Gammaproteobacteria bacterium]TXI76868.1 MAG: plasmid maintenance protein CcdB [Dokdonella sp.]